MTHDQLAKEGKYRLFKIYYYYDYVTDSEEAGLLNSRPKLILAGRPAKIGRNWLKLVEIGRN